MISSSWEPASSPVPFWTALLMLSAGMLTVLASLMAFLKRAFVSGSPPPRAAIVSSRMILVKILPLLASVAAFLCLMEDHLECPDMVFSLKNDGGILTQMPRARNRRTGGPGRPAP